MDDIKLRKQTYWDRVEQLFVEAYELPTEERVRFLEAACAGDGELFKEVLSLLEASSTHGPFDAIEEGLAHLLKTEPQPGPGTGQFVGPYRLLSLLGYGGMGAVYMAERAVAGFEQRVALKLIRHGAGSDVLRQRFFRERQILAKLEHQHIARFLDGGMTEPTELEPKGQPYLCMEYVDGQPITDYCDAKHLSVKERLQLFHVVCEAVQYAHQHLVVHRDLKPSNILVTDSGDIKLLDFGVAKLLTEESDDALTHTGMRIMTPGYAAPEQVRGESPTTATDIYSLGIVLYELLTGRRPFNLNNLTAKEIERVISEKDPVRPSAAVQQPVSVPMPWGETDTISEHRISELRSSFPGRLHRRLKGDLDTIVLRALSKEPNRRYASAQAFAKDIEHHLSGRLVEAQGDTRLYRVKKFVRRHRRAVLVIALLAMSLIAGLAGTVWQARRATIQASIANTERDRAQSEAIKAEQVSSFLASLFQQSDPFNTYGDTLTAFDILAQGAERLQNELSDQPEARATLLDVVSESYRNLGDYDLSKEFAEKALHLRQSYLAAPDEELARSIYSLAQAHSFLGSNAVAESLHVEALAMRRNLFESDHPDIATSLDHYADVLFEEADYTAAESLYVEALEMRRRLYGARHEDIATSLNSVATILFYLGRPAEAEPLFQEALIMRRELLDPKHPDVASSINNLAIILDELGDPAGAEPLYREALELRKEVFGEDHPRVSINMNNLALVLFRLGRLEEAELLFRDALRQVEQSLGPQHKRASLILNNMGRVLLARGSLDEAEDALRKALDIRQSLLEADHPNIAVSMGHLGSILQAQGRLSDAEAMFRRALEIFENGLPSDHHDVAYTKSRLAYSLFEAGAYEEAEAHFLEAFSVLNSVRSRNDPQVLDTMKWIVEFYTSIGNRDEAEKFESWLEDARHQ